MDAWARIGSDRRQRVVQLRGFEEPRGDRLVVTGEQVRFQLLQRVGERIVPDIVQECGVGHEARIVRSLFRHAAPLPKPPDRRDGQVIDADGVIEPGVGSPRIDQVGEAELPDVPKPLEGPCVNDTHCRRIESDGIP